jgi:uncharacterized membrane protein YqhA
MKGQKFYTPLKIGLLIVVIAYFLFTLNALFTLEWIGEWEGLPEHIAFWIFVSDITATVFLIFRFVGGLIAVSAIFLYFAKKGMTSVTGMKILKWIVVFEALYWVGLITSGVWGISSSNFVLLLSTGIPCMFSSIVLPVSLFKLASKLKPTKPGKEALKWGLIAGTVFIFVLWLNNATMWIVTIMDRGVGYLFANPELMISFASTIAGLLALAIFAAYFTKKSIGIEGIEQLKMGTVGAIITILGVYFLWNYLTWIFFGGWSDWYAWFLGHNLDLWLLSLPMLGLPLLFEQKKKTKT